MGRREFIALIAAAWPAVAARTQQAATLPSLGFLIAGTPSSHGQWVAACVQRLRELGWIEGRTISIAYRWAEGSSDRLADLVSEFVRLKVDIIVTHSAEPVLAAKRATSSIPIVFGSAADPVGSGLVASLAHPGGNVTGLSVQFTDLAGKRLELMREAVPHIRRLAIMANAKAPGAVLEMQEVQAAARALGTQVATTEVQQANDIGRAFERAQHHADALYVASDPLLSTNRFQISTLAIGAGLPTMHGLREHADAGGLISYGANHLVLFRRAAELVDKILKGTRPADIPIEQPTTFELVINLKTAKALGITVPATLLARADEVIE